jgi:hypothetical protein
MRPSGFGKTFKLNLARVMQVGTRYVVIAMALIPIDLLRL